MPKAVIFDIDGPRSMVDLHASAWVDTFLDFGLDVGTTPCGPRLARAATS